MLEFVVSQSRQCCRAAGPGSGAVNGSGQQLNFLVAHYLAQQGPLGDAAGRLLQQQVSPAMLPQRRDWQGHCHPSSYEDMAQRHPHIGHSELLRIMRARVECNKSELMTAGGTLLGRARQKSSDKTANALVARLRRRHGDPQQAACRARQLPQTVAGMYRQLVRCHGHKYPTFCVLFDRTGRRMITGSDDYLVKVWCTRSGFLINTFKGHQDVVTDIALNVENTMLASASADGTVRVWNIKTGEPRAVLVAHAQGRNKGIIGVKFSPAARPELRYIATACDDGLCRLYRWSREQLTVETEPIVVDGRPQARDAVSAFAFNHSGSRFAVATTSGVISLYSLIADAASSSLQGGGKPQLIARIAAHEESITTLVFSDDGTMLLTGSTDGTAKVWTRSGKRWDAVTFDIREPLPAPAEAPAAQPAAETVAIDSQDPAPQETEPARTAAAPKRVETNQVAWVCDRSLVLISNNVGTVAAFDPSTGRECWRQRNTHGMSEVYVLITHPCDARVAVSGGYDGRALVWDTGSGTVLREFRVSEQLFDGSFSEDGLQFALTSESGAATLFGLCPPWAFADAQQMPEQMFDSDYTATIMDENRFVADQQTQIPAYLVPHSQLMDFDGHVYNIQRGPRFGMNIEMGIDAVRFKREDAARRATIEAELENAHLDQQAAAAPFISEPTRTDRARRRAPRAAQTVQRTETIEEILPPLPITVVDDDSDDEEYNAGLDEEDEDEDDEVVAVDSGGEEAMLRGTDEGRAVEALDDIRDRRSALEILRSRHRRSSVNARLTAVETAGSANSDTSVRRSLRNGRNGGQQRQLRRASGSDESSDDDFQPQARVSSPRFRGGRRRQQRQQQQERRQAAAQQQNETQRSRRQRRRIASDSEEDSVTEGMAQVDITDDEVNVDGLSESEAEAIATLIPDSGGGSSSSSNGLQGQQQPAAGTNGRRGRMIDFTSESEQDEYHEEDDSEDQADSSSDRPRRGRRRGQQQRQRLSVRTRQTQEDALPNGEAQASTSSSALHNKLQPAAGHGIDQRYLPTDWILATKPSTVPYRPQVGDVVVYFREGHEDFWNNPARCQRLNVKMLPYVTVPNLAVAVYGKVSALQYGVGPPAFCTLKIQLLKHQTVEELDAEDEHEVTRRTIQVQYHDCDGVLDFVVLYSRYRASLRQSLKIGDQVSVLFDEDQAHPAEIVGFRDIKPTSRQTNVSKQLARNPWRSIEVAWEEDGAERAHELVSPWELLHDCSEEHAELPPPLTRGLLRAVNALRNKAEFVWFVHNVDFVNDYPDYLLSVAYPMCLNTVRARLQSGFYRHVGAVAFDIQLIQENAEIFNDPGTVVPLAAQSLVAQFQQLTSHEPDSDSQVPRKRKPTTPTTRRRTRRRRMDAGDSGTEEPSSDLPTAESDTEDDDFDSDDLYA
ncbi:hypothetical protein IWW42_003314 [Coemansia sp. RSA 1085]|nr:hypothetical protein IWW42_003314 [Coemansia sp. RSA 1085]